MKVTYIEIVEKQNRTMVHENFYANESLNRERYKEVVLPPVESQNGPD